MKFNRKIFRIFAAICWIDTALCTVLMFYLIHVMKHYGDIGNVARDTRIAGVMTLLWMTAAVWFTVRSRRAET